MNFAQLHNDLARRFPQTIYTLRVEARRRPEGTFAHRPPMITLTVWQVEIHAPGYGRVSGLEFRTAESLLAAVDAIQNPGSTHPEDVGEVGL